MKTNTLKWNIEYKKDNGFAKTAERYANVTILKKYDHNSGLLCLVPERKWAKDTGIRKFNYNGIISMTLAQ